MRKIEQQHEQESFRLNLGEYWRIVWRKKYFIVVPLVISAAVSMVGIRFLVPIYESSAVIRVENVSDVSAEVARFVNPGTRRAAHDAEVLAGMKAALSGSAFLDELIIHLGMDRDPQLIADAEHQRATLYPEISTDELVMRRLRGFLKSRIKVEREGPKLFRITYADANPEACFVLADAVTALYIDSQQRSKMEGLQEVTEFSEEQLSVYKERLDRSENELKRFQQEMAQRASTANPVNEANIGAAETLKKDIEISIRTTENTLGKIRARLVELLGSVPSAEEIVSDSEMKQIENNLLSRSETELLRRLRSSGEVSGGRDIDAEVLAAQQRMQRYLSAKVAEAFPNVQADYRPLVSEYFYQRTELAALRQKHRLIDSYIVEHRDKLALAPHMDAELKRLQQEVENNRSLYTTFQNSRTSTQISEAVQSTELGEGIVVVEAASRPLSPVRPNRAKILIMAILFGISVGGGGLLLTEFSDSSFRSVEDVEKRLGVKVLGTVPKFDRTGKWSPEGSRKRALMWATTCVVVVAVSLAGFYFYGKSSKEQQIDLNVTSNTSR